MNQFSKWNPKGLKGWFNNAWHMSNPDLAFHNKADVCDVDDDMDKSSLCYSHFQLNLEPHTDYLFHYRTTKLYLMLQMHKLDNSVHPQWLMVEVLEADGGDGDGPVWSNDHHCCWDYYYSDCLPAFAAVGTYIGVDWYRLVEVVAS